MYDSIIIGGGPAGLTAAIYLRRAGLKTLVLEKENIGGQISTSPLVENYPGIKSISGSELSLNLYNQVIDLGADIEVEEVTKIEKLKTCKKVITNYGDYKARTIIIATGAKYRKLGLNNEDKLIGSGIHFCATCDAPFYKDKVVAVLGGANSAVTNAIYLSNIAKKVYLIYRGEKLRAEDNLVDKVKKLTNVEILYNTNVIKIIGKDKLESVIVKTNGKELPLVVDGMFEAIGVVPETKLLNKDIKLDSEGYYIGNETNTEIDGIFVAGDCRSKDIRQLTTATSDGTVSALNVIEYLEKTKDKK